MIRAVPCENVSTGICGQRMSRLDCASAQSDQGLRCPLTESLCTIECIKGEQKLEWDFTHAQNDLNLHILQMFEDTFLSDVAHLKT